MLSLSKTGVSIFEILGNNSQLYNRGDNLIPLENLIDSYEKNGITVTKTEKGLVLNGTTTAVTEFFNNKNSNNSSIGTYTLSGGFHEMGSFIWGQVAGTQSKYFGELKKWCYNGD